MLSERSPRNGSGEKVSFNLEHRNFNLKVASNTENNICKRV